MQNFWPKTCSSESRHQNATLFSLHPSPPILNHKETHYIGQGGPKAARALTLALCPLPPYISGKVYLAAAVGSLDKKKTGSSCPPPSTGVFPSPESLGPEPASCSGGGPGLQGKRRNADPQPGQGSQLPLHLSLPRGLAKKPVSLLKVHYDLSCLARE